MIIIMNNYKP